MRSFVQLLVAFAAVTAIAGGVEVVGTIAPKPQRALVHLRALEGLEERTTAAARDGSFRFRKVKPGTYALAVLVPTEGELRRTLHISESEADAAGVVAVKIDFALPKDDRSLVHVVRTRTVVPAWAMQIPEQARRKYAEGMRALKGHDVPRALASLEEAVRISPQFTGALLALGRIAYDGGDYAVAERHYRQVLERDPQDFVAVINLGGVLLNQRRCTEALPFNERAARELPADATTSSQLAMTYLCLGDTVQALTYLNETKRIDAGHYSKPQLGLAMIHMSRGALPLAAVEIEDVLRRYPEDEVGLRLKAQLAAARSQANERARSR